MISHIWPCSLFFFGGGGGFFQIAPICNGIEGAIALHLT